MSKISWHGRQENSVWTKILGNHLEDQLFHLVHRWNISQTPRETKREFINSERKYYQEFWEDVLWSRGGIWKGDILIADIEELEKLNASETYPRRLNAKEVLIYAKKKTDNLYFLWQMVQQTYQEVTTSSKTPL